MGVILILNQISDQSILIDCPHYVVASNYHYFWYWIFQMIHVEGPNPLFSNPLTKGFILFINGR